MASSESSTARRRTRLPPGWELVCAVGGGLLLSALVLWVVVRLGAARQGQSLGGLAAAGRTPVGAYAGSRACAECHPGESALYAHSGHARTLHDAAQTRLARTLDGRTIADPERAGVAWRYALANDGLSVTRAEAGKTERFGIDFAFGSDHHATTFVTLTDPLRPTALEHHLTHFAADDSWGITPGQRAAQPLPGTTPHGRALTPRETLKCFRCHATWTTALESRGISAATMIANVGCERCHGPGRAHVAAARAGAEDLTMPFGPEQWTADSQLLLCGQCHRHPARGQPTQIRSSDRMLARFQPVGLSQSKCYVASHGALSCVTCHDPHARASADRSGYETACLNCHGAKPQALCPVAPRTGCLDCHMPKVDSGQRVLFTDHWIRIRSTQELEGLRRPSTEATAPAQAHFAP